MRIGYSLSGGGARGIAHLGIMKVLEENGIRPHMIAGVSAGSIIGAFYASGFSPDEILKIIVDARLIRILRPAFSLKGILSLENTDPFFRRYMGDDSFEKLKLPLVINAVNLRSGTSRYFSTGSLIQTVLASCAIPAVFKPVKIDGELYVDGGVLDNLPVKPLEGKCDHIIGFHCNPVDPEFTSKNMKNIIERTFILVINTNVAMSKPVCGVFLEPGELKKFGAFDFDKAKEIFEVGYEYGRSIIPEIKSRLHI
ncbi:MAG TPA: patatin-like phospholipase family protein [Cyclobacteriaceae bacterium]|nr:patatin-like phospholipase family protein [Cyclobacteriaceae bacterium]